MNKTSSDTSLIIGINLKPSSDVTILDMVITIPNNIPEPCLVHYSLANTITCGQFCMNSLKVSILSESSSRGELKRKTWLNKFPPLQNNSVMHRPSPFGTKIEYTCGLGMEYQIPESNMTVSSVTIECDWNATWTPYTNLPKCICVYLFSSSNFNLVNFLIIGTFHRDGLHRSTFTSCWTFHEISQQCGTGGEYRSSCKLHM